MLEMIDDTVVIDDDTGAYGIREDWLTAAVSQLTPLFAAQNLKVPAQVRVACGFPSNARRSGAIGECWSAKASADKTVEILISPTVDQPRAVLEVLVHELVHACGYMTHAASKFGVAASKVGLKTCAGSWKATEGDASFDGRYSNLLMALGTYPHAKLSLSHQKPKQPTRLLKAECPSCGYIIRTTSKHANRGLPTCVCGDHFVLASEE